MPFIQEFVDKHKEEPLKGLRIKYGCTITAIRLPTTYLHYVL